MSRYKFRVNDTEYITVDAPSLEEALEQAGIKEDESYEIIEGDDFKGRSIKSAISDDILQQVDNAYGGTQAEDL